MVAPYTADMPSFSFKDLSGRNVAPKLRKRLWMFLVIAVVILGFIVNDVITGTLSWWLAILGVALGTAVGIALGRMVTIRWHETDEHAISQLDTIGYVAIGLYLLFALTREWLFGHWLQGPALTAFTLSVLSGALFGRLLGMLVNIRRLLEGRGK